MYYVNVNKFWLKCKFNFNVVHSWEGAISEYCGCTKLVSLGLGLELGLGEIIKLLLRYWLYVAACLQLCNCKIKI